MPLVDIALWDSKFQIRKGIIDRRVKVLEGRITLKPKNVGLIAKFQNSTTLFNRVMWCTATVVYQQRIESTGVGKWTF
jgi:hypothetical protein